MFTGKTRTTESLEMSLWHCQWARTHAMTDSPRKHDFAYSMKHLLSSNGTPRGRGSKEWKKSVQLTAPAALSMNYCH